MSSSRWLVAEMLKLNQQTVRNMIDRGDLAAVRVGAGRIRVRQSQLDAFLAAGETSQEAEATTDVDPDQDRWRRLREAASTLAAAAQGRTGMPLSGRSRS